MAWKEHSQLSVEDKQHQDAVQKMIVCQSQLDRAVDIAKGRAYDTDEEQLKGIKDIASELVDWVYKKANEKEDTAPASNVSLPNASLPTPTAAQVKVLNAIFEKVSLHPDDKESIQRKVLDWAEKTHGVRKYPERMDSVETLVKELSK